MKILIACSSTGEGIYCNLAVVELNVPKLIARNKVAVAAGKADTDLDRLTFWDHSATFREDVQADDVLARGLLKKFERDEYVIVPDDFGTVGARRELAAIRTECDLLHVGETSFYWSSVVKHSDVKVETREIPLKLILGLGKK